MRIAALGRTRMLLDTIHRLAAEGHTIPLIATGPASPESEVREADFAAAAERLGAAFAVARSLNTPEAVTMLRRAEAALAVSVNWPTMIGPAACAAFPLGILNAHAGDLPRYRGNAPVAWAILQGESRIGVTVHVMDPLEIDAGPILLTRHLPLTDQTHIGQVFTDLETVVPVLLVEAAEQYGAGHLTPVAQQGRPLRCYPRRPEDARLIWSAPTVHLDRLVRASSAPFDGAFAEYERRRLTVWRARAVAWSEPSLAVPGQVLARTSGGEVHVATGDGVLVLSEVSDETPRRQPAGDVIRSARDRLRDGVLSPP